MTSRNPENTALFNFLIEKTKDVKSPLIIGQLAREFKETDRADKIAERARQKIKKFRHLIYRFDDIDTGTKVKLIFALSAPINVDFLENLKKEALVEVDEKNRITYYKESNGTIELRGIHYENLVVQKTPQIVMSNNKNSSAAPTPDSSTNKRKTDTSESDSSKRTRPNQSSDYNPNSLINCAPRNDNRMVERPQLRSPEDTEDVLIIPKQEILEGEAPLRLQNQINKINSNKSQNPKIKFFETIQSLILFLDTPSLSQIQLKVNQKIQEIEGSDEVIQNNEVILVLELLITRITNHSVSNLSENVESVGLIQFLCYLKAAVLNSKMIGVEGLVENIKRRIEEAKNERVPMEKMMNALRSTLDIDRF